MQVSNFNLFTLKQIAWVLFKTLGSLLKVFRATKCLLGSNMGILMVNPNVIMLLNVFDSIYL